MLKLVTKKSDVDLLRGSVLKALIVYSIPLIITNVIQLLFHATDVAVLGIMAGDHEVAAVGACGSLISLLVSLFNGLATGTNVLVAKRVGAADRDGARRAVGTSLVVALLSGFILMVVALVGARYFLILMNCQAEVLDSATAYMRIYFCGMPILMLYNFVAGILRSVGDSTRPMMYMLISGCLNVCLNVLFVGVLRLTVAGVAIATVLSNFVALLLAFRALVSDKDFCKLEKQNLVIRKKEFADILRVGIPSSLCGIFFYIANVIVSTAVNSMGTEAMTANAIAGQYDSFIYVIGSAIAASCMAFVGQNMGARKLDRVKSVIRVSVTVTTVACTVVGLAFVLLSHPLCSFVTSDAGVIAIAQKRMLILCMTYVTSGIMEILSLSLSSMGWHRSTMYVGFFCGLGARVVWAKGIWPALGTLVTLYISFPVSNLLAIGVYILIFRHAMRVLEARYAYRKQVQPQS